MLRSAITGLQQSAAISLIWLRENKGGNKNNYPKMGRDRDSKEGKKWTPLPGVQIILLFALIY